MCRRGLLSHLEAKVRRHGVLEKSCGRGKQTKTKSSIVALSNTANKTQGEKDAISPRSCVHFAPQGEIAKC